jgi:hypothetical protein
MKLVAGTSSDCEALVQALVLRSSCPHQSYAVFAVILVVVVRPCAATADPSAGSHAAILGV